MKAIAVVPGKPDSVHLADLAKPAVDDVPGGRGVLVKILRVGVDGTDRLTTARGAIKVFCEVAELGGG